MDNLISTLTAWRQGYAQRVVLYVCLMVWGVVSLALALDVPSGTEDNEAQIAQYLKLKYGVQEFRLYEHETFFGVLMPMRSFFITGPFDPPGEAQGQAFDPEASAQAFFRAESNLFGLTPRSTMRQEGVSERDERGLTSMVFYHYLDGIRLDGTGTGMRFTTDGKISNITLGVVQITDALLDALKQPTLSERDVRRLVKKTLIARGFDIRDIVSLELEKVAIALPPYVLWDTKMGLGGYVFDAFTGTILQEKAFYMD